jgi:septal ring factor EnvC (AmiA/AmiB activator)
MAEAERRRELAVLRRRLAWLKSRYEVTRQKAVDTREQLGVAEADLDLRTTERRVLEIRAVEAERDATRAQADRDDANRQSLVLKDVLARRLSALYRMGRLGYLQTLASTDSGEAFLRGLQLLSFLAGRDARLLRAYEGSLADLAVKEKRLAALRASIAVVAAEAREAERAIQRARAEKAALLARLERAAEEQRTNVAVLEDKTSRLAALLELLETRGRALPAGAASIRRYKGAIDWPAQGKVVVPFGRIANPRFPKTFLRSSGWTIDVPVGTPVKAVFAGDVVYAQWLKGYGNLVVLDHGDGVFTLYGHLMTGTAPRGTRVALGEAVGRLADPPEEEVAGVYFEIRESRTSVDPRGWLR